LKERYQSWLNEPDPAEIDAWTAIRREWENPLANKENLEVKLREFIGKFPHSTHKAEVEAKIKDIKLRRMEDEFAPLLSEWEAICAMPEGNIHQIKGKEVRMDDFIKANRRILDYRIDRFQQEHSELKTRIAVEELKAIRYDFDELLRYIRRLDHQSELYKIADEYLWALVTEDLDDDMLKQFVKKVPASSHYDEAKKILDILDAWLSVKKEGDIFNVIKFINKDDNLPDAIKNEADDVITTLKRREIELMEDNPSAYPRRRFLSLVRSGLITVNELKRRDLITDEAYVTAENRDKFIEQNKIRHIEYVDSDLLNQDDITDVYLFGVPSTGKTCVLMGLLGSGIYDWNSAIAAGEYGDFLTLYRDNQTLPERTLDEQFFCIHGKAEDNSGKKHLINVIELAGEQFLSKIAMNPDRKLSLVDMDAIAADHLKNKNRKIFFIVIDPTVKEIIYTKKIKSTDDEGNMIDTKQDYRIAQKTVIKKMMNILRDPQNTDIMKKVDALHFIATKADVIDHVGKNIKDCVTEYNDSFKIAYELCQPKEAQINEATGYKPKLYSFSLGKFYVGGAFEYDSSDSDKLMRVITENTLAIRDYSFIEKFCDKILNYKVF